MRSYRGVPDLSRLARFLTLARTATGPCGFYHLGDLSWNLYLADLRGEMPQNLRLWEDPHGNLLGFAWFYPPCAVDLQTAPWHPDREALEEEMLAWALALCRQHPAGPGQQPRLTIEAFEQDHRFLAFLERHGFQRDAAYKAHLQRDLRHPIPAAELPVGYHLRALSGPEDLLHRAAVQKAVWPWSRVTAENYPALRSLPGYRPELDLVCEAPNGTFAAFALGWSDEANRVGEFEPVGTHPDHRGRGLGRALLWEGFRRMREQGATTALVYPPGGELPAERLYASAGFQPLQRQFNHSRPVRPSPP